MLIIDSVVAPRLARGAKKEWNQAQIQGWCADQMKMAVELAEQDSANAERMLGNSLTAEVFEAKLKKLCPALRFEFHEFNPNMKSVYHMRNGEKHHICPYGAGLLPEHSVMRRAEEYVRDFSFGVPGLEGSRPIERADLPKHEFVPGQGFVFDKAKPQIGMKKIEIPYGEATRGWRTVLLRIVEKGVCTPDQVESVFGADNTAAWATHMGKQQHALLW